MNRFKLFITLLILIIANVLYAQNSNLMAYYPFNGNADDESGNGNNGTVIGATLTQDRFGNDSSAYLFNGVDNYIAYPVLWNSPPDSITLVAWLNADTSQYDRKVLYHGDNGEIQIFVSEDSAGAGVHLGQSVTDPWYYVRGFYLHNEWQMIAVIWIQGESFRLYINSVLADSVSVPVDELLDPGPKYLPSIGSYGRTLGAYFNGMIDDIRIYGRVLAENEIDSLFNEGTTSVNQIGSTFPINYNLYQNYPNPFNPSTKIEYSIPEQSYVELKVYDVLGNEVATLVNEEQSAGTYRTDFNGESLASGLYIAKLQAGDYTRVIKMALMK